MSATESSVLMLYGPYFNENVIHPFAEDIYRNIAEYQTGFRKMGLDFVVGMMVEPPTNFRQLGDTPEIRVIRNPQYNESGKLVSGDLRTGKLENFPAIMDHCVIYFHGEKTRHADLENRSAMGLGVDITRTWNPWPIQNMGNNKEHMDIVLEGRKAGIPSYAAAELEQFEAEHGDIPTIYKPLAGARGKGILDFQNLAEAQAALSDGRISGKGRIQPLLDLKNPIPGLIPAEGDNEAAAKLKEFNSDRSRQREVRMHVIAHTDEAGQVHVEAFPTLKYGEPGLKFLKVAGNVALSPESMGPGHPMHDASTQLAKDVLAAASHRSGQKVPQYYGTFDWMYDGQRLLVGDANSRGPAIAEEAIAARRSLITTIGNGALQIL